MPSYPRPHAMVQALAERAEDFILQSYKIRDVPLRLRPVSTSTEGGGNSERRGIEQDGGTGVGLMDSAFVAVVTVPIVISDSGRREEGR